MQMGGLIRSGGRLLAAVVIFRFSGNTHVSLCFYALHKWLVSHCCRGQRQCMTVFGTCDRAWQVLYTTVAVG